VLVRSLGESLDTQLKALSCPVELVWGDDDTAAPLAQAEQAASLAGGGAQLTVCPGAGHLTPLTAPDALRAAVERSLGHVA
jgi:pimeloyl-ACP methyl ester carboxylesterase